MLRVFVVTLVFTFAFAIAGFFTTLEAQRLADKAGVTLHDGFGLIAAFLPFIYALFGALGSGVLGATYGWRLARSW